MKKTLLYFFFAVSLGEILSILISAEGAQFFFKPLIMITLGAYYRVSTSGEDRSNSLVASILFSLIGDVLLMFQRDTTPYFMLGLASFLIAHVFYILTYRQHKSDAAGNSLQGIQRIRFAFPIILAGTGLIVILYPVLGNLKFPVILYALIMVVMVLNALFRYGHTNYKSFWMVLSGAMLFMISDAVLAINKFLQPMENGVLIVMLTYSAGQFLIVRGLMQHYKK